MIPLSIGGGFYESEALPQSAQECINWWVNIPQTQGALSDANLFGGSGLVELANSGEINNQNRGSHVKAGLPYFLNGETLYRLDRTVDIFDVESFNLVSLGTIPGENRASFADNGTQLIVLVDGRGWIINEADATPFQEITDPSFTANGTPQQVIFIDSFFLVTTDSKRFIRSDANDGLSWDALNVFSAEADPDDIVAPINFKGQAFIGGKETIENFQDVGGNFQRTGLIINKGIFAPFGIVKTSDSFMFVGGGVNETPAIWELAGNQAQKVSTTAIDFVLGNLSAEDIEAAFTYSYAQRGAYFVGFTFPTVTFEFNTVTRRWNKRESRITDSLGRLTNERWRVNSLVEAYNRIICGDAIDGRIGELDPSFYMEYEEEIVRTFSTTPFTNEGNPFSISKLALTMESGSTSSFDTEPVIRMSTSKNGGKTFNQEKSRGFGLIGEYCRQVIWRKLGRFSRFAVIKFVMSDPVNPTVIKLEAAFKAKIGS